MFSKFLSLCLTVLIFIQAPPAQAKIDYGKQTLIGADFANNDLKGSTFYLTNLQNADLSGSDLTGASLFGAKLKDTNMRNAILKDATLDSAVFDGTNLQNAFLEDAFAFSTRFKDVDIQGSDFTNVMIDNEELKYLCSIASGVNPISNRKTKETLNCLD